MAKNNDGWLRRETRRVTHAEEQTDAQRRRAPLLVVAFLAVLVLVAAGVWAARVFIFEPSEAASTSASTSAPSSDSNAPVEAAPAPEPDTCELDNTQTDISATPPDATRWVVEGVKVIPEVQGAGPCIDMGGFKAGFAQSQAGAVAATYYYGATLVASNPGAAAAEQAEYALVDGPMKIGIVQRINDVENGVEVRAPEENLVGQEFVGYRILSYDNETAVVELLIERVQDGALVGGLATLTWVDGDWRIDPASPTEWASPNLSPRQSDYVLWDSRSVSG